MKYLIRQNNWIINESITGYDWELLYKSNNSVRYIFRDSENNQYLVEIKSLSGRRDDISTEWELSYFVYNGDNYSVSKLTGVNPYKICKTVLTDILSDFINNYSWIKSINIHGLSKDKERSFISQRTKMYLRHLERNPIIGYKITNNGNIIKLVKI
jgi:hypothetical protein